MVVCFEYPVVFKKAFFLNIFSDKLFNVILYFKNHKKGIFQNNNKQKLSSKGAACLSG